MSLTIYGSRLSPFTRKVLFMAMIFGIKLEYEEINPYTDRDALLKLNPLGKVPVLEHDDFVLPDSSAICCYLESRFTPKQSLFPRTPRAHGKACWIEEFSDTKLFRVVSGGVFGPLVMSQFFGETTDMGLVDHHLQNKIPPVLSYLERELNGADWFAGDSITLADISVYAQLVNLLHADRLSAILPYPSLTAHFNRLRALPIAQKLFRLEELYLQSAIQNQKPHRRTTDDRSNKGRFGIQRKSHSQIPPLGLRYL